MYENVSNAGQRRDYVGEIRGRAERFTDPTDPREQVRVLAGDVQFLCVENERLAERCAMLEKLYAGEQQELKKLRAELFKARGGLLGMIKSQSQEQTAPVDPPVPAAEVAAPETYGEALAQAAGGEVPGV